MTPRLFYCHLLFISDLIQIQVKFLRLSGRLNHFISSRIYYVNGFIFLGVSSTISNLHTKVFADETPSVLYPKSCFFHRLFHPLPVPR